METMTDPSSNVSLASLIAASAGQLDASLRELELVERGRHLLYRGDTEEASRLFAKLKSRINWTLLTLLKDGRIEEACEMWQQQIKYKNAPSNHDWMQQELDHALERCDYEFAGNISHFISRSYWSSQWWPSDVGTTFTIPNRVPRDLLTVTKLRHDAAQFRYLRQLELLPSFFDRIIDIYTSLAEEIYSEEGDEGRKLMDRRSYSEIGDIYNRIVYIPECNGVHQALSRLWRGGDVENQYLSSQSGIVVIDDFLSSEALAAMRKFCMESTVWSGIKYSYGRLGAFFKDGFQCPLLLQIAHELRQRLPQLLPNTHPLRHIWGFKNTIEMPPNVNLHADFAAVNVNFWITPEESNLDRETGGMEIYDVDAPLGWDFHTYNGSSEIIQAFLRENEAQRIYIPYRQNRCIIFNSDLFHGTHSVRFENGYENQRINVTFLYGDRSHDVSHPPLTTREDLKTKWRMIRSYAFSPMFRRGKPRTQ